MKSIVIFAFLISVKCELNQENFDWTSLKPITQIKEYREAFPWRVAEEKFDEGARVFDRSGRIVRGEPAAPSDYPFSVGLVISFTQDSSWCSGSLISRNFVLTAGSCLIGSETQATALLGASDITRVTEFLLVSQIIVHERLNRDLDNDIGLLRLQREIMLNANVQIARLPNFRQRDTNFEKQKVFVAGWGATGASNEAIPTQRLRAIRASVITNTSCRIRFLGIRQSHICTDLEVGTPCNGDEGSALTIIEFDNIRTQIGIFSYQSSLGCDRGWPPVYTRVTSFLDWIEVNSDVVIRPGFD